MAVNEAAVIDVGQQDISQELEQKKDVIRRTVAKDANPDEFEMFMHLAKTYQLDPFQGEIFLWKYNGDLTIMTSRDGYLKIANRHPEFDGLVSDVVHRGDNFKKTPEGVQHTYGTDRGPIVGAYALVYRKDRKYPTYVFAPFEEYAADKKVWKQYPSAMILKCAESMALKRAFSVSGLVSREEMEVQEAPMKDITPNQSSLEDVPPELEENPIDVAPEESEKDNELAPEDIEIPFGKYKGKKMGELPTNYLEWIAKNARADKYRMAAKEVIINRGKAKNEEENQELNPSDRELEIMDLIGSNENLKKVVQQAIKFEQENVNENAKTVDDLSESTYQTLIETLKEQNTELFDVPF